MSQFNRATLKVVSARVVPTKDSFGKQTGNIFVIQTEGNEGYDLVRTEPQALIDLKNSMLIDNEVQSLNDESVRTVLKTMMKSDSMFEVTAEVARAEANSDYVLNEYSREVIAGTATVGEVRKRKNATLLVKEQTFVTIATRNLEYDSHISVTNARLRASLNATAREFVNKFVPGAAAQEPPVTQTPQPAGAPVKSKNERTLELMNEGVAIEQIPARLVAEGYN